MTPKFENILNLALETEQGERERSALLDVGYDSGESTWETIVKYHGSLEGLRAHGIQIEYLIAGYAILTVPEVAMEILADTEEIEYVELPKEFYYQQVNVRQGSCIGAVTSREPFLTGEGVLVAVLDSGIWMQSEEFREEDGRTKIVAIWDQTRATAALPQSEVQDGVFSIPLEPPAGFFKGVEINETQINAILQQSEALQSATWSVLASIGRDNSGHGTAVAGIAAGRLTGVAPDSRLLIVKMDSPQTADVMRAVVYALQKARELGMPLVMNLSLGNTYGSHDGTSLLERFLDNAVEIGRTVICVGAGNEGNSRGHYVDSVFDTGGSEEQRTLRTREIEIAVDSYQPSLSIQLWKNYQDNYRIYLESPGGERQILDTNIQSGKYTFVLENTQVLAYLGEPIPYSVDQEIFAELLPQSGNYISSGLWKLILEPVDVRVGNFSVYLPSYVLRNEGTGFTRPSPLATFTIPSTAGRVITVAAYNSAYETYADFSGRGFALGLSDNIQSVRIQKPDLAAPGVDIIAPDTLGGYGQVTGTSFATPIVSGSVALLMEWGIIRGNDPFLYGEKMKAYLQKGARPLRSEQQYPNPRVGWGALCVYAALPE